MQSHKNTRTVCSLLACKLIIMLSAEVNSAAFQVVAHLPSHLPITRNMSTFKTTNAIWFCAERRLMCGSSGETLH